MEERLKKEEEQRKKEQEEERRRKDEKQQAQMEHEHDADIDSLFEDDGEETLETVSTCNETGTPDLFGGNRGGYMRVFDDDDEL
jgi:hypothetical protein